MGIDDYESMTKSQPYDDGSRYCQEPGQMSSDYSHENVSTSLSNDLFTIDDEEEEEAKSSMMYPTLSRNDDLQFDFDNRYPSLTSLIVHDPDENHFSSTVPPTSLHDDLHQISYPDNLSEPSHFTPTSQTTFLTDHYARTPPTNTKIDSNNNNLNDTYNFLPAIYLHEQPSHNAKINPSIKPLVYSAIGSLEHINHNSFDFKREMAQKFAKLGINSSKEKKVNSSRCHSQIGNEAQTKPIHTDSIDTNISKNETGQNPSENSASVSIQSILLPPDAASRMNNKKIFPNNNGTKSLKESDMIIDGERKVRKKTQKKKRVTINENAKEIKPIEVFRPSCDAYTPRMGKKSIKYKPAEERASMDKMSSTMGTLSRPNFRDALRRVAMIIRQHIIKIERRFENGMAESVNNSGLFSAAMRDAFMEENFIIPRYKCTMVKIPMAKPGVIYGMRKVRIDYKIPSENDIYEFGHQLFKTVQLSSECSIISLIYIERLMEKAKVPLLATTWKPIFMCGLLLASKVWQDWSSWNIEFATVYPQFSLESINKLELQFLKAVKWDLYISSSLYAKYYFALRSLLEKQDFRQRYIRMIGGPDSMAASQAIKVSKRSEIVKEAALSHLSISM